MSDFDVLTRAGFDPTLKDGFFKNDPAVWLVTARVGGCECSSASLNPGVDLPGLWGDYTIMV